MKLEAKLYDLRDLSEGDVVFIAESFLSEATDDMDKGHYALAEDGFEKALSLYQRIYDADHYRIVQAETRLESATTMRKERGYV